MPGTLYGDKWAVPLQSGPLHRRPFVPWAGKPLRFSCRFFGPGRAGRTYVTYARLRESMGSLPVRSSNERGRAPSLPMQQRRHLHPFGRPGRACLGNGTGCRNQMVWHHLFLRAEPYQPSAVRQRFLSAGLRPQIFQSSTNRRRKNT